MTRSIGLRHLVAPALAVPLVTGCSGSSTPLQGRPTDLGSARDLAQLVADTADCGSLEDYSQGPGYWEFTCPVGEHTFDISTVPDPGAKLARLHQLAGLRSPVKAGDFFLVQEALDFGPSRNGPPRPNPVSDLDRFPGQVVRPAG